jgi:hypothetical protein
LRFRRADLISTFLKPSVEQAGAFTENGYLFFQKKPGLRSDCIAGQLSKLLEKRRQKHFQTQVVVRCIALVEAD